MKKRKKNKGLFDKKRFTWMEKERIKELKAMTFLRGTEIQKELLNFSEPLQKNFVKDNPVSYEMLMKKRKCSN